MAFNPIYGALDLSDAEIFEVLADLDASVVRKALSTGNADSLFNDLAHDIAAVIADKAANAYSTNWQANAAFRAGVPQQGEI